MAASETALPLRIGTRTLLTLRRRLIRHRLTINDALAARAPSLPALDDTADGYLLRGLPANLIASVAGEHRGLRPFFRQAYQRRYATLTGSFDSYLDGFSAKSRSSLLRKSRKLAKENGDVLDVRRCPGDLGADDFYALARAVSSTTYQERLLEAGLPAGEEALAELRHRAQTDGMRGWLLFLHGEPIAYLHAPAEEDTLIYAYLGYDPRFAALSPGTVLQLEAMRQLMEEGRFRLFDFTEGDGQHKRQFATGQIDSVDLLLIRPSLANICALQAFGLVDRSASIAKRTLIALGAEQALRRIRC